MNAWLFDLGNTRLKCAPLVDGRVGDVLALPHRRSDLAAALAEALPPRIDVAHVASVANDDLRVALLQALAARSRRISLARTQRSFAGVRIAYAQPHKLGVDRFLALLAVHARFDEPVLLCGVGTALTVDLIDAGGCHVGGRIAPSPTLMRESLHDRAPQLPPQGGEYGAFASDTEDALVSGCMGAALGLVEHSRAAAGSRLGRPPRLVVHGGGAEALIAHLPDAAPFASLVLEGLAIWAAGEADA